MTETNNWLIDLFFQPFSSAAVAIVVLLTISYFILTLRRWLSR
jgi:hypothetical protein